MTIKAYLFEVIKAGLIEGVYSLWPTAKTTVVLIVSQGVSFLAVIGLLRVVKTIA